MFPCIKIELIKIEASDLVGILRIIPTPSNYDFVVGLRTAVFRTNPDNTTL